MANPVKAARKEGRKMVKEARQSGRAAKVTAKYAAKTEKIKSKNAASAPKSAEAPKPGVTGVRIEGSKASVTAPARKELAQASTAKRQTPAAKKTSTTKKSSGKPAPKKSPAPAPAPKKSTSSVKRGLYDGVADPKKKIGDYTLSEVGQGAKNTVKAAAADAAGKIQKINKEIVTRGKKGVKNYAKSIIDPFGMGYGEALIGKKQGGAMKPSYKKGGYMMSTKKKKK